MTRLLPLLPLLFLPSRSTAWGFYGHKKINYQAVFLLPPEMIGFYKSNIQFITDHAVDPDMRRYAIPEEGARHYIDIDHYGKHPYDSLPRYWKDAVDEYSEDSLQRYGIVPWWILTMLKRLTIAFQEKDAARILKLSAEIGHYISDAHVPLHACSNHNGQFSGQSGIHGFWESRIPELLAEKDWDFYLGAASYIPAPLSFTWRRVLESALAADSVLWLEKKLSARFPPDQKYSFEERKGKVIRQYSSAYSLAYHSTLNGMVERRMRQSIFSVASIWYTAWVDAGQPPLAAEPVIFSSQDQQAFEELVQAWRKGSIKGREH